MLDLLRAEAFSLWGAPTSWAELLGAITGALCVWWVAKQNIWSWPVGIANNALFFVLFWTAKLYGDALLQIVFAVLGVYGWWRWKTREREPGSVRHARRNEAVILGFLAVIGVGLATTFLALRTDSPAPLPDAAILVLSLVATYGQAHKIIESWWVWIAVDVISVPLYVSRDLMLTAVLYFVYGLLCVKGLLEWRRSLAR